MSLSVIVPVFDEVENLGLLYDAVDRVIRQLRVTYEIILVNDGSTDGSAKVLETLALNDPRVKVIEFRKNYGQTAAIQAGIEAASMDVIVLLDGDLQNDPNDIPLLLAKLNEGFDLVHGWRKNRQDDFLLRTIPSKVANWLISKVTGFPAHDIGCTLKVIRAEIAGELQLQGEMHRFIPILAHWRGARCVEIETRHHPRKFGKSKYGISRTTNVLLDLVTVMYVIRYAVSPMKLFGSIGLLSLSIAALTAMATVGMTLSGNVSILANPLLLISAMSAFAGVQFLLFGLLGELCSRTWFAAENQTAYTIRSTRNFDRRTIPFTERRVA